MAPPSTHTLLLLCLASTALQLSAAITWENCAPPAAPVTIQTVTMSPDPALSGGNFTLKLPAVTDKQLQGGSVSVYVTYYGIPVHVSSEDLCDRTPCPVEVGSFLFSNTEFLPSFTPSGQYKVWLTATASDGSSVLFCTKVSFRITRPALGSRKHLDRRAEQ